METDAGPVVYVVDKDGKVAVQRVVAEHRARLTRGSG